MRLARLFGALALAIVVSVSIAPRAGAAPDYGNEQTATREGASYITGTWFVSGAYADPSPENVGFDVTFSADGTFIDRDNYRGRWIVSGASFVMYYPDESQLGYAGTITGDTITGRFDGLSTAGTFEMRRR